VGRAGNTPWRVFAAGNILNEYQKEKKKNYTTKIFMQKFVN
jgi:hypothetical protein